MAENDAKPDENSESDVAEQAAEQSAEQQADAGSEQVDTAESADSADENTAEAPEESLESLTEQLAEARDMVLRAQAEAQNTRRRAEKDVEHARKYALEKFCSELLPVVDNLERALDAADMDNEGVKPVAEGVDLTLKSFLATLEKFQLVQIDPTGEPFDPQLHQAMTMVPNPDM